MGGVEGALLVGLRGEGRVERWGWGEGEGRRWIGRKEDLESRGERFREGR